MLGGEQEPFFPGPQILSHVPDLASSRKVKPALKCSDSATGTPFPCQIHRLNTSLRVLDPSAHLPAGAGHTVCSSIHPAARQKLLSVVALPPLLLLARQVEVSQPQEAQRIPQVGRSGASIPGGGSLIDCALYDQVTIPV